MYKYNSKYYVKRTVTVTKKKEVHPWTCMSCKEITYAITPQMPFDFLCCLYPNTIGGYSAKIKNPMFMLELQFYSKEDILGARGLSPKRKLFYNKKQLECKNG